MKVLFVASANKGKIGPLVKAQGNSLAKRGVTVEYYGIKGRGLKGYLSNIPGLRKTIKQTNPDIIHAHYSFCGFVAALTLTNKPIVVSLMGSDIQAGAFFRNTIRFFYHRIWDAVIVKSPKMKSTLNLSKAHITPNGVDLSRFMEMDSTDLKKKFGFDLNKKTILFLADPGRHEKNYALAARAFEHTKQDNCRIEVKYNLSHREMPEVLNAADVILLTSKWEGSPNVVKEAMACNRPVVATNVGDIEWLFGNEPGHFLTTFDPQDVASKIEKALEFARTHGRTNGHQRILQLALDTDSVAEKIISIYKSLL